MMINMDNFKGYIHDVGGPTANFRHLACDKQAVYGACKGRTCAAPEPCENLNTNHDDYIALLRKLRKLKGVKKYLFALACAMTMCWRITIKTSCASSVSFTSVVS